MKYFELCELSHELAGQVMQQPAFLELMAIKKELFEQRSALVEVFQKAKDAYDQVLPYGKYHPDYQKCRQALIEAKEHLYSDALYRKYKELEKLVQMDLDAMARQIEEAINLDIDKEYNL